MAGPLPASADRLFERRGQHVYFEAPGALGLDGVYAFARANGLTILDVRPIAGHYLVKAVDTP